jgi:hypothetical protein
VISTDDIPTSKGTETVWSKDADDLDAMDSVVVRETRVRGAAVWLLVQARCLEMLLTLKVHNGIFVFETWPIYSSKLQLRLECREHNAVHAAVQGRHWTFPLF